MSDKPICLCPPASEYDPPCPEHGVVGIGVTPPRDCVPGKHALIALTEIEKRAGGKTLKHFDVRVARGGTQPAPKAAPAAAPAEAKPELTAEQAAAIEALKAQGVL